MPRSPELPLRMDPLDRELLLALDVDPGAGFTRLAEQLGVSARTVARRYERLVRGDVLRVIGRALPTFEERTARLVLAAGAPTVIAGWARRLRDLEGTRYVRITADRTQLVCGTVARPGASDPLWTLMEDPRLQRVRGHELLQVWAAAEQAATTGQHELDETDRAILHALEHDGRLESSRLAARLGLDPSLVSRRRRRLLAEGVLYLEADIHPAALADTGDALLWMHVPPGSIRALGAWLRADHRVRFAAATSGEWSLVAHVAMPDRAALVDFVDGRLAERGVARVEIMPLGPVLKRTV